MILPAEVSFFGYFKVCNRSKQKTFDFSPVLPNGFTVGKILVVDLEVVVSTCVVVAWACVVVAVGKILVVDLEAIVDICAIIVGTILDVVFIKVVGTADVVVYLGILLVAVVVLLVVSAIGCVISDAKKCKELILI
jgi:hypothetical protein